VEEERYGLPDDDVNMTLNEFLLEAKYKPRERMYERKLPTDDKGKTEFVRGNTRVSVTDIRNRSSRNIRALRYRRPPVLPLTQICQVE
ncbi:hypothetical protein Anas_06388, partial [Armadillidium nasatum]